MDWLTSSLRRLGALWRHGRIGRDLEEEMRFHLEMKAQQNRDAGMADEDAERAARLAFGNRALALEDSREAWRFAFLEQVMQDVRYAARGLVRSPVFAVAVMLTLALGIGANATIFTLIDAVILRTLPVERPSELYVFGSRLLSGTMTADGPADRDTSLYSYPMYRDLREHTDVFPGLAAISSFSTRAYESSFDAAPGARVNAITARLVTGNFFSVLGVRAAHGRVLGAADDQVAGANPVAVLSYRYWSRRYAADPAVVGRDLRLNGTDYVIVGVTAPGFDGVTAGSVTDVWVPVSMQSELMREPSRLDERDMMWLRTIGRVVAGVDVAQAQARTDDLFHQLVLQELGGEVTTEIENELARLDLELVSFAGGFGALRRSYSQRLLLMMGMTGLVLLIACANVGNLLLARASARGREISLRLALGSGRRRLLQQMLTESLLLACCGGAAGLLLALWAKDFALVLISSRGSGFPLELRVDARVAAFTVLLTMLTAVAFGLAPAWRATRVDFISSLRQRRAGAARTRSGRWDLREALVVSQVALSLLLLIGAGLFLRSLHNLRNEQIGLSPRSVLLVDVDPRGGGFAEDQLGGLYDRVIGRLEAVPGVQSASFSYSTPFSGTTWRTDASIEGFEARAAGDLTVQINAVTPEHLRTIGVPLLEGRGLSPEDRAGAAQVAVVNQAFARHFFGDEPAIGKRFGLGGEGSENDLEIVGVTGDVKYQSVRGQPPRFAYVPVAQSNHYLSSIEVRASGDAAALAPVVRAALAEVAGQLPILDVHTLSDQVEGTLYQDRLFSRLTGAFGGLAVLLASIGLYGVLAYGVARRTGEIGVRVALGAGKGEVMWMILRGGLRLLALGVVVGLPVTLAAGRLASSLLYGLEPTDPATVLTATLLLTVVTALAALAPAWRASRLDPVAALRES